MRHKLLITMFLSWLAACAGACSPRLGDGCDRASDCSVNLDRFCDVTQPGGYCTIADCEPGSCGDEGRCVRFEPDQPRLTRSWCMAKCSSDGDCDRDRYVCRSAAELNTDRENDRIAEVLDSKKNGKFCVVKEE